MNKKNLSLLFLSAGLCLLLSSCGKDDENDAVSKEQQDKNRGIFSAKIDGEPWAASKIEIVKNSETGFLWPYGIHEATGSSIMIQIQSPSLVTNFPFVMEFGTEYSNNLLRVDAIYHPSVQSDPQSSVNQSGTFTIFKLNSDSLVADFNFATETDTISDGKIKISLK